jgi:hypothetical protein
MTITGMNFGLAAAPCRPALTVSSLLSNASMLRAFLFNFNLILQVGSSQGTDSRAFSV